MPTAPKLDRYANVPRTVNMVDPPIRRIQWTDDNLEPKSPIPTPRDLDNPPGAPKALHRRLPYGGRVLGWD
jgi:hypothetical protein